MIRSPAKLNIKLLVIILTVAVVLVAGAVVGREAWRRVLSARELREGQAAFEKKDWKAASEYLLDYLVRHPGDSAVLDKYAQSQLRIRPLTSGNVTAAIAVYQRLLRLEPGNAAAYERLANIYRTLRLYNDLAYLARKRLEAVPGDIKATLWLAQALVGQNKSQEARELVESLIKTPDPTKKFTAEYVEAYAMLGYATMTATGKENIDQARKWLDQAVSYAPDSPEAWLQRSRFIRMVAARSDRNQEADFAAARADLERADALNPGDLRTRLILCEEWIAQSKFEQAAAELSAVSTASDDTVSQYFLDPIDWEVARFLQAGELVLRQGQMEKGPPLADKALATFGEAPQQLQALPLAIQLYVAGHRPADGRRCLDKYLDLLRTTKKIPESRERIAYLQVLVLRAENQSYAVIDLLEPVTAVDAPDPSLLKLLAEAYSRTEQNRRAIRVLERYLRLRPRDPNMLLQLAREYMGQRDWTRAIEIARQAEALDPAEIATKLMRIESGIYTVMEKPQAGKDAYAPLSTELAALRRSHPVQAEVRVLQAIIANNESRSTEAEKELAATIKECPDSERAELYLARLYVQQKRFPEAIQICQSSCARHAETAAPWECLAEVYSADQKNEEAQAALQKGRQVVTDPAARKTLGLRLVFLQLLHGNRAGGIALLKEMARQDPREVQIHSVLLSLPEVVGDPATAAKLLGEMRKAEGESGLFWRLHQAALWLADDQWRTHQQDVVELLTRCITADPAWATPTLFLARMYEALGRPDQAETTYRHCLAANPTAVDVADRLGLLLEAQRRFPEAIEVLNQLEADPRIINAHRIRIAIGAGDFSRAIDGLKILAAGNVRDADARIALARLTYQETKNAKLAMKYLDEAQKITPESVALVAVKVSIMKAEKRLDDARRIIDTYVNHCDEAWQKVEPQANHGADALRLRDNAFMAHLLRGVYFDGLGNRSLAEKDYVSLTTLPDNPGGFVLLSRFYLDGNQLDKAVDALTKGVAAYPDDLDLKRQLMSVLFARGGQADQAQAEKILTELETRKPNDPDLLWTRGRLLLAKSDPESTAQAKKCFERAVQLQPALVEGHLALAALAMQRRDYQGARDLTVKALAVNPHSLRLLLARAMAENALNNRALAQELVRSVLKDEPDNLEACEFVTASALSAHDPSLYNYAHEALKAALAKKPDSDRLIVAFAGVLNAQDKTPQAIAKLETYTQTEVGRRSVLASLTLAELYRISADYSKADRQIDLAATLAPDSPVVAEARIRCLASQKKFDEILALVSALAKKKIESPDLFSTCAGILASADSDQYQRAALGLYEKAIALSPRSSAPRLQLALLHYRRGEVDQAEKTYRELLIVDPNNSQALNDLAWILAQDRRDYKAALELSDRGLTLDSDNVHLRDTRGVILRHLNRPKDALRDFEQLLILAKPPDGRAKALLQLARTCAELNKGAETKRYLDEALQIDHQSQVFSPKERAEIDQLLQVAAKNG